MKSFRWIVILMVVLALLAGGYSLYHRITSSPQAEQGVETIAVRRGNLMVTAAAFGSISFPQKVKHSFPTAGVLTEVGVAVGDQVTQGQVLARLDEGPLRQAVLQAQVALRNAELALKGVKEPYSGEDIARQEAGLAEALRAVELARRDVPIVKATGERSVADAREALNRAKATIEEAQRSLESAQREAAIVKATGGRSVADAQQALDKVEAPYSEEEIIAAGEAVAQAQKSLELAQQDVPIVRATGERSVADAREALNRAKATAEEAQRSLESAQREAAIVRTTGERSVADAQQALDRELDSYREVMLSYTGRELRDEELLKDVNVYFFWATELPKPVEDAYKTMLRVKESLELAQLQAEKSLQAAESAVARGEETLRQAQANLSQVEAGQGVELAQLQAEKSLQTAESAVARAEETLRQAQVRLAEMVPDPEEVERARLNLELAQLQAEKSLQTAENAVAKGEETLRQARASLFEVDAGQGVELAQLQAEKSLQTAESAVARGEETLRQAQVRLAEMKAGGDPEEIAVKEIQVSQARLSLEEAEANLEAARLVASFSGVVAEVGAEAGDRVASGAPVVVLVDTSRVEVSATVDEVDVARVQVGQPAIVTLDALPGTGLRGQVKSISPVARVQAGVVSYPVVISVLSGEGAAREGVDRGEGQSQRSFAAPRGGAAQAQPREGMSASAEIVVEMKQDVLLVPSRAVRVVGGRQVVSVKTSQGVEERPVVVGSSDGRNTEITSGLEEGEAVVLTASSGTATTPLGQGMMGGGALGGGRLFR